MSRLHFELRFLELLDITSLLRELLKSSRFNQEEPSFSCLSPKIWCLIRYWQMGQSEVLACISRETMASLIWYIVLWSIKKKTTKYNHLISHTGHDDFYVDVYQINIFSNIYSGLYLTYFEQLWLEILVKFNLQLNRTRNKKKDGDSGHYKCGNCLLGIIKMKGRKVWEDKGFCLFSSNRKLISQ